MALSLPRFTQPIHTEIKNELIFELITDMNFYIIEANE